MKSELRKDQLNKAVVGPKLDTRLREGERVVMKTRSVPKSGSTSLPNAFPNAKTMCISSPCLSTDTAPGELDVKKTFFWRSCTSKVCPTLSGLRKKVKSSLFVGAL